MTHPLTDSDGLYDPKVRDRKKYGHLMWLNGADWQLDRVIDWLDANLNNYTDDNYLGDCKPFYELIPDLEKAMRPVQDGSEGQDRAFSKLIENNSAAITELADS